MRILLVILIFGICWQNILACRIDYDTDKDHEKRLQRLEDFMLSQKTNQATNEERLKTLETLLPFQDDYKDGSAPPLTDIEESQEPEESNYNGEDTQSEGETSSEYILSLENTLETLMHQIHLALSHKDSRVETLVYPDHEQRLQRLEAFMHSQEENKANSGHEDNLQTRAAWFSSQDDNKDSSAESQEPEESNYIGDELKNAVETEEIIIFENIPVDLYDQILSGLSHNDNQDSRVVKAKEKN